MISVVINTIAGADFAAEHKSSKGRGEVYAKRAAILRDELLPWALQHADETVVVGAWEPGDGYTYVPCGSPDKNVWDQLLQKHKGWEQAHGDVGIFLCDDQLPAPDFMDTFSQWYETNGMWDILSPMRRMDGAWANPGWGDRYAHAHGVIARASALDKVPWMAQYAYCRGTWALDVPMTTLWRYHGLQVHTAHDLILDDREENQFEKEWRERAQPNSELRA